MKCPHCQSENPADARFCGNCGAALPAASPPPPPHAAPPVGPGPSSPPPPRPTGSVSDGLKIGITVATIFIPLVGIIMGIIYLNDPSPEKKKAGKLWVIVGACAMGLYCLLTLGGMQGW